MSVPDISVLSLDGHAPVVASDGATGSIDTATTNTNETDRDFTEKEMKRLKDRANALPYSIEPHSQMIELLNFIVLRLTQCVEAKDYDVGMTQWDSMLSYWMMLKYPIPKPTRIHLAKLYYELALLPHSTRFTASCADTFKALTRSKTKLSIADLRLSWKPVYEILSKDLFLNRRQFEYTQLTWCMGYLAENARRFYHPNAMDDMLSTFIPQINANNLDSVLATQYYMTSFLPLTHPQSYLPMLFRWWESVNSYQFDERMLSFMAKLAEMHVDPAISETSKAPDDEIAEGEKRPGWSKDSSSEDSRYAWPGLYKDVGIFTEHEWGLIMCKCLASMEIPLADAGSLTTGPSADAQVSFEISRLPKPGWRIASLARIIVYSIAPDGIPAPASNAPTPFLSPTPSGVNTPQVQTHSLREFLSAPLNKAAFNKGKKYYLAGSKALDSLVRLIASTESFFHPANSGAWTTDLSAFIKYIVYDFNRRWHEEQQPDCKTPFNRRLTKAMKRELVKSLRTVTLLAMFSQDSSTVSNIQSCMKSMSVMEPDLILYPVLERAIPSLEALVETQRTKAVIKALGAIASSMVCRDVYYPGAKHLVEILQLLIPGIDLNDPSKTLCTTAFLVEISQHIKFGDLTDAPVVSESPEENAEKDGLRLPFLNTEQEVPRLSDAEEDALLRESTGSFADWISSFIRRVIQLMENLPDEGPDGSAGGTTETQVVDAVAGACNQICVHLSDELYDLVLNMVFDYASTTVRSNAVRAIHQLVECVANANAEKTLKKFIPFCVQNIQWELDNGASGVRTTSSSRPAASDATLHWNLAILRGTVYNDGKAVAKHRKELLSLLKLLHAKTFSKRGYSWTGKLLSSLLLTLTHTYPLENKFVNPDEWSSPEFKWNHHKHWGKMYTADQVKISWHVPNEDTIDFALEIFRELIEPTLAILEDLLKPGLTRDAIWRNEFCRHLTLVRNAFAGIPTMLKENPTEEQIRHAAETSDILGDIPEMIAAMPSMASSFCLTDPSDPSYIYISTLKSRFGKFLHNASTALRVKEGEEENTFDAVYMIIRSMRTFLMDYGDSRDNYFVNEESFNSERNVARQFAGQKEWPRAIFVRQARYYHSARLRWNSTDRYRTPLQDAVIDDIVEWSLWHYPQIREASQSLLDTVSNCYDGTRRRALPVLQEALSPGTGDDRMKGALWTLHLGTMGKYAVSEPLLAPKLMEKLLKCSHNEKPSIQNSVQAVADNCIANFIEPTYLGFEHPIPASLVHAVDTLKSLVPVEKTDIVERTRARRIERVEELNDAASRTVTILLALGEGKEDKIHWRYRIMMIRLLRTLIRRDKPMTAEHMKFILTKTYDSNPTVRYYAQRALMKATRNMKLRTYCSTPFDLYLGRSKNPLRETLEVASSHANTEKFLKAYKEPFDPSASLFRDKTLRGLVPWDDTLIIAHPPDATNPTFKFKDTEKESLDVLRDVVCNEKYWKDIKPWFEEENGERVVGQDHISSIKSIYQALGDEPLQYMLPVLESLLSKRDSKDSQRAAAELLCGVIGGSKLWPLEKQKKLWEWFEPHMKRVLSVSNIKTDTSGIWTSFLEYVFYCKDPRRLQPLVSHISELFLTLDFNTEFSFDATKILSLYRAFYEELGGKFSAWVDETVDKVWSEGSLYCDHEDVRSYAAEILVFTEKIKRRAKPTTPHTDVLLQECRVLPLDYDIMGMRGTYHLARIEELVKNFKTWRSERKSGARAFQSVYDRVGVTVCRWLFQAVHDINAIGYFDYILPLIPELFRFTELNDNSELSRRASILLVRMCGVPPPRSSVHKILDAIFDTIQHSPSWRIKLKALPLLQVFYFRNLPFIPEPTIIHILEVLCNCLDDEHVQVREMASTTLSGVLRLSPRKSVLTYRDRFVRLARTQGEGDAVKRQKHAGILGICALVDSYPYTVERWMPKLLTGVLVEFSYEPAPISTTIRRCASNFKKTHQDTWHEDLKKFTEEELISLSTLLTGSSYYA